MVHSSRPHAEQTRLFRTESLKSEKSDRRVSFNKDVGVKRIPRGLRQPPARTRQRDEWVEVAKEYPDLTPAQLSKEAHELLQLLDKVDCSTAPVPPDHPFYPTRSLDRPVKRNNEAVNNARNRIFHAPHEGQTKTPPSFRTANPISRTDKENVNYQHEHPASSAFQRKDSSPQRKDSSLHYVSDSGSLSGSDCDIRVFKSVPNLSNADINNKYNEENHYKYRRMLSDPNIINKPKQNYQGSTSVDNLIGEKGSINGRHNSPPKSHKSVDNIIEYDIDLKPIIFEHNSVDHLPRATKRDIMSKHNVFRPKVENIIARFNAEAEGERSRNGYIEKEAFQERTPQRIAVEPDKYRNHNNNQPFSYTKFSPLTSVQVVRRLSPTRDPNSADKSGSLYAKVNKKSLEHITRQQPSRMYHHYEPDHEYSAKIIITDSSPKAKMYQDDSHVYETYQMQESKIGGLLNENIPSQIKKFDLLSDEEYMERNKGLLNNNINMSSVAVQTDTVSNAASRGRKMAKSSLLPARIIKTERTFKNDLASASLVRQVNHGFGRIDTSPSPPLKATYTPVPKNVVPLLSDASDCEFDYYRQRDPLAKIRDQVMQREMLKEDREAEENETMEATVDRRAPITYHSNVMRPLTIEEVDSLNLTVDKNGKKSIIVAEPKSHTTPRTRHQNEKWAYEKSPHREESQRPMKPPRERSHEPASAPGNSSSLSRTKKSNAVSAEHLKKESKGKKKRIKIKFFYDPQPQDTQEEDPLQRFTEYKGTSSDERLSPRNEQREGSRSATLERRSRSRDSRSPHDNRKPSWEKGKGPPPGSGSNSIKEVRDNRVRAARHSRNESFPSDMSEEEYVVDHVHNYKERDSRQRDQIRLEEQSSRERKAAYTREQESRSAYRDPGDAEDLNDRASPQKSFSTKYQSRSLYDPIQDPDASQLTEEEDKEEKIKRQRNKFFASFMNDSNAKSATYNNTLQNGYSSDTRKVPATSRDSYRRTSRGTSPATNGAVSPRVSVEKTKPQGPESKFRYQHEQEHRESRQRESSTLTRTQARERATTSKPSPDLDYRLEEKPSPVSKSSVSSGSPDKNALGPTPSFKQRYFGDSDVESSRRRPSPSGPGDYRSLPNRVSRAAASRMAQKKVQNGLRGRSPNTGGSTGSSFQSSESEPDSHHGSNASKVSHVSTSSNRSVYLHPTAVADIPVKRGVGSSEGSDRNVSRQTKKVSRSFSLVAPWKPRHYREKFEVEYDNKGVKGEGGRSSALPPRPPRRHQEVVDNNKKVSRSQSMYKDSRLTGWLKRKKNKDVKGI